MSDASVLVAKRGRMGHLHLNRPKALNALTLEMIDQVTACLRQWASDDVIELVMVTGEGDRAFCAGADVKSVYFAGVKGERGRDGTLPADLLRHEYTMNHLIATFQKPYVSYWDGVTMGGGVGVSVMGSHRIASQKTQFAMPETGIGLFPDVGGSYFLSRLGPIGKLLGLTGQTIDAAATLNLGLATHYVPSERGEQLIAAIADDGVAAIESFASDAPRSDEIQSLRELASQCFAHDRIESIVEALAELADGDSELSELAAQVRTKLSQRSPTSLKIVMEQMKRGKNLSFSECLVMEYRLSQACMEGHDFYEGIRAVLVDKDHQPKWNPASLERVRDEDIEKYFQTLGDRELKLPGV